MNIQILILYFYLLLQFNVNCYSSYFGYNFYCLDKKEENQICDENLQLYANPLFSVKEFHQTFYDENNFCTVDKSSKKYVDQNLGQTLFGDKLQYIPYVFEFGKDINCHSVCKISYNKENELNNFKNLIQQLYTQRWFGDNIPVKFCPLDDNNQFIRENCTTSFLVGCGINSKSDLNSKLIKCLSDISKSDKFVIFNHLNLEITYKKMKYGNSEYAVIIYITVYPVSTENMCKKQPNLKILNKNVSLEIFPYNIHYTYSIKFIENKDLKIANRWDYFLLNNFNKPKYQWMNLSAVMILFIIFSFVVGLHFYKLLSKDIVRYTQLIDNAHLDIQDEYGWKLLQGDVFRPPKYPMILATSVGCGVQLISMVMISLLFAAIGLISRHHQGAILTCVVVFYLLFGVLSGYVSARLYKFFGGTHWKMCVLGTSIVHPGILFLMLFLLNFWLWVYSSPSSIPPLLFFGIFILWIIISVPLTFFGSFIGFKHQIIQSPVKINHIPRFIPQQGFMTHRIPSIIFGGLPPFICLFWQLYFLIQSIWGRIDYVMFQYLFIASLIAVVVCAEIAVLLGYLHLSAEDYRWQWRSFFTTASTSLYCFIVVIYYFVNSDVSGSIGGYAYFTYSMVILYMLALALGSVGFLACFFVFLRMYSSIKVD